jgi:dTMP kinase
LSRLFVTFEGVEGSGKTTQLRLLKQHLDARHIPNVSTREPGGTTLGNQIRSVILDPRGVEPTPLAELLLIEACRNQHVVEVIRPALEREEVVLCDRFTDATVAYQGYAHGIDRELIASLNSVCAGSLKPDVTFLLDCPVEVGLKRTEERMESGGGPAHENRFEMKELSFHQRVRDGYLRIAREEADRVHVIDGTKERDDIHREIRGVVDAKLQARKDAL